MQQLKIYLPPPANWQDFQGLVKSIAAARYDPDMVTEYGSQGQSQGGIDVFALDRSGKNIGIQCKETKKGLTTKMIDVEATKAKSFTPGLNLFIIATTAKIDKKLQDHVNVLNASTAYEFQIRIDFWDDLISDINRYAMVLNTCYDSYKVKLERTDESNHLACLRVAFDRPAFTDDFNLERNFDNFESALIDTIRLFKTGFCMDRWSQIPVIQTIPAVYLPEGKYKIFVGKLESQLSAIYKNYMTDKHRLKTDAVYCTNRSGYYNIVRGKALTDLNNMLQAESLTPIAIQYI